MQMSTMQSATILMQLVEGIREIHPKMEAQKVTALCIVAREPGISMSALSHRLGLTLSAASRNVSLLTDDPKRRSLGLVVRYEDPQDRRNKRVKLNERGEAFWQAMSRTLDDSLALIGG